MPEDENPAVNYLALLVETRRWVRLSDLNQIAQLLTDGMAKAHEVNWTALRFQHTAAVKSALASRYNYNGANRMLCALRGVLKAAWRLGQMKSNELLSDR